MPTRIELLDLAHEAAYRDLCTADPTSLVYHTLEYRDFLASVLPAAAPRYLLAFEGESLRAALPAFRIDGPHGVIVNSLPFYGSNGGILSRSGVSESALRTLLDGFNDLCLSEQAVMSTIVMNPLRTDQDWVRAHYQPDFLDSRIGQLTRLPEDPGDGTLPDQLMSLFHQKTRNMVRKGIRGGFQVVEGGSDSAFRALHRIHDLNMESIGGLAKSWSVFDAIRTHFTHGRDYRLYMASRDDVVHAALLVLQANKTAEYFTPVVLEESRSDQPLSHLIFQAMQDAVHAGCEYWNWGGTWHSQEGVHRFKSRWGTTDIPYAYLVKSHGDASDILSCRPEELLSAYPDFFVVPFSELNSAP